jgi:hypothetical protein
MLENVQIISDHGKAKFAVIDFEEFEYIKSLLLDEEKLQDYLDYLHIQTVKQQSNKRLSFEEVRQACASVCIPATQTSPIGD